MRASQIRELVRDPLAMMRFQTSGRLPEMVRPLAPLITVLQRMSPRERVLIRGLTVDERLGYSGSRVFHTAEQALRWCAPAKWVNQGGSWPAESWRIKSFCRALTVQDVLACARSYPEQLDDRHRG